MAEGKNKIALSLLDLQPTAILEFFIIYPDKVNHPTVEIRIHAGSNYTNPLTWQGKTYTPVPIEVDGFEQNATAQLSRPKIRVANQNYLITDLLQKYGDFKNAKIVRKRTFIKYLDDVNFEGGNPYGDADSTAEISNEEYVVGQKTQENKVLVEFELSSPLDLENFEINNRRILGKYCYWSYRGCGCNYQGVPIQQEDGKPFMDSDGVNIVPNISDLDSISNDDSFRWETAKTYAKGDVAFIENSNVLIHTLDGEGPAAPMKIWYVAAASNTNASPDISPSSWQKDGCNKKLSSCRLRFNDETQVAYQTSSLDLTTQLVDFSGIRDTGYIANKDPDVLQVMTDNSFTLGWWFKGGSSEKNAGYLQTSDDTYNGYNFYHRKGKLKLSYSIDEGRSLNATLGPANIDDLSLVLLEVDRVNKIMKVSRDNSIVFSRTIDSTSQFPTGLNQITFGINTRISPPRTPNFKLGPCMLWSGILSQNEKSFISITDKDNVTRPLKYSRATGNAASITGDKLIFWLEETGAIDASNTGFLDSTLNVNHFSGDTSLTELAFGGTEVGYTIPFTSTLYRKESTNILPFGGFPGTDGFSFKQ